MARLYANENFPLPVVEELRKLGYDVVTTYESGKAGVAMPDAEVLAFAVAEGRALLTLNRRHFIRVCTFDPDFVALAHRIHAALEAYPALAGQLVRVNRPG